MEQMGPHLHFLFEHGNFEDQKEEIAEVIRRSVNQSIEYKVYR